MNQTKPFAPSLVVTLITDCKSPIGTNSTDLRQQVASLNALSLYNPNIVTIHSQAYQFLRTARLALDTIDESTYHSPNTDKIDNILMVNCAPREDSVIKGQPNGQTFGFQFYKNNLIITTLQPQILAMFKEHGICESFKSVNFESYFNFLANKGYITKDKAHELANTQFRSKNCTITLAKSLIEGQDKGFEFDTLEIIEKVEKRLFIADVDEFGNLKIEDLDNIAQNLQFGKKAKIKLANKEFEVNVRARLTDCPLEELALIKGSNKGKIELVYMGLSSGKSAQQITSATIEDSIEIM
jgi:hypothetical protein